MEQYINLARLATLTHATIDPFSLHWCFQSFTALHQQSCFSVVFLQLQVCLIEALTFYILSIFRLYVHAQARQRVSITAHSRIHGSRQNSNVYRTA